MALTSKEMPQQFWAWFDVQQKELGLNDSQVARLARVAHSVISKARNGMQPIGYEALSKIAPVLQTPISTAYALAGYIEPGGALSPEKAALMAMFDELSDDDREEVLAIIRVRARQGKRD